MIGETSYAVFPAASPAAFQGCPSKALPSCCSRKQAGLLLYLSRTGRGEGRWEQGTGRHSAGLLRGIGAVVGGTPVSILPTSPNLRRAGLSSSGLDQSQTRVSKEGGVKEVQQHLRCCSPRHQDHPQNHAVLLPRCPSPAAPGLWSPSALPVPDRALGPGLGRHPYLSAQSQRRRLGRSPALPGRV